MPETVQSLCRPRLLAGRTPKCTANMSSFLYFGYGSNMLTERLTARCPSAWPVGPACAPDFAMRFAVQSEDGSSKAGLLPAPGAFAWGVLYEIELSEQHILDRFEHEPVVYTRTEIAVSETEGGETFPAVTYLPRPEHVISDRQPYDWYRALCLGGARQHLLPEKTIAELESVAVVGAPYGNDLKHNGIDVALKALTAAGFATPDGTLLI